MYKTKEKFKTIFKISFKMEKTRKDTSFRITVEPLLFTITFTLALAESVVTNLMIRQSCRYEGFEMDNCTGSAQIEAQRTSSFIESGKVLIETLIPSILSFFIGPWSDTHGRKILMFFPMAGCMLYFCGWSLLSRVDDLNPVFLLSSSIFIMMSGGYVCVLIGCFCYLADITEPEDRAFRMAVAEVSLNSGQLLGYFLSPYVFKWHGYLAIFIINASLFAISLIYIIFFIEETIEKKHVGYENPFKKINPFDVLLRKRENYGKIIILLTVWISIVRLISMYGETSIKYMSTIAVFNWDIDKYSTYNTIYLAFVSVLGFVGLWLCRSILKMSENITLLFALITRLISGVLLGMSKSAEFFYFATMLGCLYSFVGPLVKSKISSLVEQEEVGKIFALLLSFELLAPQIAVSLYTTIYAAIIYISPFAIFFISAFLYFTGIVALVIIMTLSKKVENRLEKTKEVF